jgi:DNA-binding Lrp family transcriptional regulator
MRDLDDIDRRLIRLLLADARRPYSELAEAVDLSAPAVSDRVDRLRELGVVERFTLDLDRSRLRDGIRLIVTLSVDPGATAAVREALAGVAGAEHVFETADGRLVVVGTLPDAAVRKHLAPAFETGAVEDVDVSPIVGADRHPGLGEATLGLDCAECGNTVTSEGVTATVGGETHEFCCESCETRFRQRYEELEEGA